MTPKPALRKSYSLVQKYESYFLGNHIEVTSDGEYVLCDCVSNISCVNVRTSQLQDRITFEDDAVTCFSLSPDNTSLVVALKSSSIHHYQWPEKNLLRNFKSYHDSFIGHMCWDESSTVVVTTAADGNARVWNINKQLCTHCITNPGGVFTCIQLNGSLEIKSWFYGSAGETIYIWEMKQNSAKLKASLKENGHFSTITAFNITKDKKYLVSCGLDKVVIVWDLALFCSVKVVPVQQSISGMLLQPSKSNWNNITCKSQDIHVLLIGDKGVPCIWDVWKSKVLWKAEEPLVPLPDSQGVSICKQIIYVQLLQSFVYATYDQCIHLVKDNDMQMWKQLCGHNDVIVDVIFVGECDSHIVLASNSVQLRIFDSATYGCEVANGHEANVVALARHPTKLDIFASSSLDKKVLLWLLEKGGNAVCIASASGHFLGVGAVVLAKDFVLTGSQDLCLKKWSLSELFQKERKGKCIELQNIGTKKAHLKDINTVCISRNNQYIATGSGDKTVKVWDSKDLVEMSHLKGHNKGVWCVQFSPVDQLLASASDDATIRIWALSDMTNVKCLEGHSGSVLRLCWITNGLQLVSVGGQGLMKVWDVRVGACLNTFECNAGRTWALGVSGDGKQGVTGGDDGTWCLWKDVTQEEAEATKREIQEATEAEQEVCNLVLQKKWAKAICLTIRLQQPFRCLTIMKDFLDECPDELGALVLDKLKPTEIESLLSFVMQWNTKTKHVREAQTILNFLLRNYLPEELEKLHGWHKAVEGMLPYTQRHHRRLSAMSQACAIVKYMASRIALDSSLKHLEIKEVKTEPESEIEEDIQSKEESGVESEAIPLVESLQTNFCMEDVYVDENDADESDIRMDYDDSHIERDSEMGMEYDYSDSIINNLPARNCKKRKVIR